MKAQQEMWRSLSGVGITDIVEAVRRLTSQAGLAIHVGTDAKNRGFFTDFVTVITLLDAGNGGRVFYQRTRHTRMKSLAQQLFREAELSLDAALQLSDHFGKEIVVHVDANEDELHRSSRYVQALAGMVVGHGFEVKVKPNAWCATHVADYLVKGKHLKVAA